MTMAIDEIVSKEALEQLKETKQLLQDCVDLQKKIGNNVAIKISVLSDLLTIENGIPKLDSNGRQLAIEKIKQLIPLL